MKRSTSSRLLMTLWVSLFGCLATDPRTTGRDSFPLAADGDGNQEMISRPQYLLPSRIAAQVARLHHRIRTHGRMDRRVLAVLLHEKIGAAVNVGVGDHRPQLNRACSPFRAEGRPWGRRELTQAVWCSTRASRTAHHRHRPLSHRRLATSYPGWTTSTMPSERRRSHGS